MRFGVCVCVFDFQMESMTICILAVKWRIYANYLGAKKVYIHNKTATNKLIFNNVPDVCVCRVLRCAALRVYYLMMISVAYVRWHSFL